MPPDNSKPLLPDDLGTLVRSEVEFCVESKLKEYKRLIRAFLLGFSFLIAILVANRLISQNSILVYLHDQIFGSDRSLSKVINASVALSYSDQFTLTLKDSPAQYLTFYANNTQNVIALIEIKHHGPGSQNRVFVRLDQLTEPIWDKRDDLDFSQLDLTEKIRQPARFAPPTPHLHNLAFQLDKAGGNPGDEVHVRVLINVSGLEQTPDESGHN